MTADRQIRRGLEKRSDFIPAGDSKLPPIDALGRLDLESRIFSVIRVLARLYLWRLIEA